MPTGWQKQYARAENVDWWYKSCLIKDVYAGNVDQVSTDAIAVKYHLSHGQALRLLKHIVSGKVRRDDYPFEYVEDREGVKIANGSIFTFSPMDVDGQGSSSNGRPKHYIWFCS